jgi:cystathionine beta-lyase family protein involved in aluminum resistance
MTVPVSVASAAARSETTVRFFKAFFSRLTHCSGAENSSVLFRMLTKLGYKTSPNPTEIRHDIIQMVEFGSPDKLLKFCAGIQHGAPVDSYVTPVAWEMPGYAVKSSWRRAPLFRAAQLSLAATGQCASLPRIHAGRSDF